MSIEQAAEDPGAFDRSRERFQAVLGWLQGQEAGGSSHADLEARLQVEARELFRLLLQDHLDLRAGRETRLEEVLDAQGVPRGNAEAGMKGSLMALIRRVGRRICGRSGPLLERAQ